MKSKKKDTNVSTQISEPATNTKADEDLKQKKPVSCLTNEDYDAIFAAVIEGCSKKEDEDDFDAILDCEEAKTDPPVEGKVGDDAGDHSDDGEDNRDEEEAANEDDDESVVNEADEADLPDDVRAELLRMTNEATPCTTDVETEVNTAPTVPVLPPRVKHRKRSASKQHKATPRRLEFPRDDEQPEQEETTEELKVKKWTPARKGVAKGKGHGREERKGGGGGGGGKAGKKKRSGGQRRKTMQDREIEHNGTWVQCSMGVCMKWRHLRGVDDPTALPDQWTCCMNTAEAYNSCEKPQQQFDQAEHDADYVFITFTEGSLVWAKMDGYPWWPAIIEIDPDTDEYCDCRNSNMVATHYHVVFLDEKVSRAWITKDRLQPLREEAQPRYTTQAVFTGVNHKKGVMVAWQKAQQALQLSLDKRLHSFGFSQTFKGKWAAAECSQTSKEEKEDDADDEMTEEEDAAVMSEDEEVITAEMKVDKKEKRKDDDYEPEETGKKKKQALVKIYGQMTHQSTAPHSGDVKHNKKAKKEKKPKKDRDGSEHLKKIKKSTHDDKSKTTVKEKKKTGIQSESNNNIKKGKATKGKSVSASSAKVPQFSAKVKSAFKAPVREKMSGGGVAASGGVEGRVGEDGVGGSEQGEGKKTETGKSGSGDAARKGAEPGRDDDDGDKRDVTQKPVVTTVKKATEKEREKTSRNDEKRKTSEKLKVKSKFVAPRADPKVKTEKQPKTEVAADRKDVKKNPSASGDREKVIEDAARTVSDETKTSEEAVSKKKVKLTSTGGKKRSKKTADGGPRKKVKVTAEEREVERSRCEETEESDAGEKSRRDDARSDGELDLEEPKEAPGLETRDGPGEVSAAEAEDQLSEASQPFDVDEDDDRPLDNDAAVSAKLAEISGANRYDSEPLDFEE